MRYRMAFLRVLTASFFWSGFLATTGLAQGPALTTLEVFPPDISLTTSRARQAFVVKGTYADGITRDVTTQAKVTVANPALVRLDKNVVHPMTDGATDLIVEFGGRALTVPTKIANAKADRPISFKLDVMPIFMKAGCNAGSCHGAARGKDGFRLSLFGYDADGD